MSRPKIKTGDQVLILTGKDKGKKGKVLQVLPSEWKVVVDGINSATKNVRARKTGDQGQRVQYNAPVHLSNVMLIDPKSNQPTRVGSMNVNGKRTRRAVRTKESLS